MNKTPEFFLSLHRFLSNLEAATGIEFCFRDYANITKQALPTERYNHNCSYCRWVKQNPNRYEKCWLEDWILTKTLGEQTDSPFLRYCHAGVAEAIVPVKELDTGNLLGVVFCGQVTTSKSKLLKAPSKAMRPLRKKTEKELRAAAEVVAEFCRATVSVSSAIAESQRAYFGPNEVANKALEVMAERFRTPITLAQVAKEVYLSPSRFAHVIKEVTGKSFTSLLRTLRMSEAHQLLAYTELKVYDIAERVGFDDAGYFHRLFKRTHGMTPADYRERVRRTSAEEARKDTL